MSRIQERFISIIAALSIGELLTLTTPAWAGMPVQRPGEAIGGLQARLELAEGQSPAIEAHDVIRTKLTVQNVSATSLWLYQGDWSSAHATRMREGPGIVYGDSILYANFIDDTAGGPSWRPLLNIADYVDRTFLEVVEPAPSFIELPPGASLAKVVEFEVSPWGHHEAGSYRISMTVVMRPGLFQGAKVPEDIEPWEGMVTSSPVVIELMRPTVSDASVGQEAQVEGVMSGQP